jgi:hypothetical protein
MRGAQPGRAKLSSGRGRPLLGDLVKCHRNPLAIVRGFELLPLDDFIALDRRDSLADAIKAMAAAK